MSKKLHTYDPLDMKLVFKGVEARGYKKVFGHRQE